MLQILYGSTGLLLRLFRRPKFLETRPSVLSNNPGRNLQAQARGPLIWRCTGLHEFQTNLKKVRESVKIHENEKKEKTIKTKKKKGKFKNLKFSNKKGEKGNKK